MTTAKEESDARTATMRDIADSHREVVRPTGLGASLGQIFIACEFKGILAEEGFAIVPKVPTEAMRAAWKRGWFRSFGQRYSAMVCAAWPDSHPQALSDDGKYGESDLVDAAALEVIAAREPEDCLYSNG